MVTIETVRFVPVSAFGFPSNIFEDIADDGTLAWGTNNRSLVEPGRIAEILTHEDWADQVAQLRAFEAAHPGILIDLEN